MKLISSQGFANIVAKRWLGQYPETEYKGTDKWSVYENLSSLGDNPSIDKVNEIIGNESWTRINCDNCNLNANSAISFTIHDSVFWICGDCLINASNLINENP